MLKVFGKTPAGARLQKVKQSHQYNASAFQNVLPTPMMAEGTSYPKMILEFFTKSAQVRPPKALPYQRTDLKKLSSDKPSIVWFGHSSYLIHSQGINILVDPVLDSQASPFSFSVKPFEGADNYRVTDLPPIDVVLITHDHYDHLNYPTISKLANSFKKVVAPIGVGQHLEHWGVHPDKITELDWWQDASILEGVHITATPARHFSGRLFKRNQTLWSSYVLKLHDANIFVGGDSGYDEQFKRIGEKHGPFDIAILECGQYGLNWPYIHMFPEETAQAAKDLHAKVLLPVHWAKFALSQHNWDEPIERLVAAANALKQPITTPMIGEPYELGTAPTTTHWWDID